MSDDTFDKATAVKLLNQLGVTRGQMESSTAELRRKR